MRHLSRSDTIQLLQHLKRLKNLRAFGLMIEHWETPTEEMIAVLDQSERKTSWRGLRTLHLALTDWSWLKRLPAFENLQILNLGEVTSKERHTAARTAKLFAGCPHLRALIVNFHVIDDTDILITIARNCPLLQRLHVHAQVQCQPPRELTGDQISLLAQALPRIELLSTNLRMRINSSKLRDLAIRCPQLTMLDLRNAQIVFSQQSLAKVPPFQNIRLMQVGGMFLLRIHNISGTWIG